MRKLSEFVCSELYPYVAKENIRTTYASNIFSSVCDTEIDDELFALPVPEQWMTFAGVKAPGINHPMFPS